MQVFVLLLLYFSAYSDYLQTATMSVGAGGLVVEYGTRNFHVASANLALGTCKQP